LRGHFFSIFYNPVLCKINSYRFSVIFDHGIKLTSFTNVFSSHAQNGVYRIKAETPNNFANVYCRMTSLPGCSGGGWTMVMKINGNNVSCTHFNAANCVGREIPEARISVFTDILRKFKSYKR
jgi:hypothetical protein